MEREKRGDKGTMKELKMKFHATNENEKTIEDIIDMVHRAGELLQKQKLSPEPIVEIEISPINPADTSKDEETGQRNDITDEFGNNWWLKDEDVKIMYEKALRMIASTEDAIKIVSYGMNKGEFRGVVKTARFISLELFHLLGDFEKLSVKVDK